MKAYKFRVLIDTEEEAGVFRDIVINSDANFEKFHTAIIKSFEFSGEEMASFYISDNDWCKGNEIGLLDMSGDGNNFQLMAETNLDTVIKEKGDKLIYVYDFLNIWNFFVELLDISPIDKEERYPYLEASNGIAPSEYTKDVVNDLITDMNNSNNDNEDDYNDNDMEFEDFENIDDYDF